MPRIVSLISQALGNHGRTELQVRSNKMPKIDGQNDSAGQGAAEDGALERHSPEKRRCDPAGGRQSENHARSFREHQQSASRS